MKPVIPGGTVELQLSADLSPIIDGQGVQLQLGLQNFYMFVLSVRVGDMDMGSGTGVVDVVALNQDGSQASLTTGCRVREFTPLDNDELQLSTPYALALQPSATAQLEGARMTIRFSVRDFDGRQVTAERAVVAHLPAQVRSASP
jgi:hypothetical protein